MRIYNYLARDLQQYGFTVRKIIARYDEGPRILVNSIPKSGTNLLTRCLYLDGSLHRRMKRTIFQIGRKKLRIYIGRLKSNQFLVAHLHYSEEYERLLKEYGIKNILMIRDPRDILLSKLVYIKNDRGHYLFDYVKRLNDTELLNLLLNGDDIVIGLHDEIERFLQWTNSKDCLVVKYEELVGENGGGDYITQREAVDRIYKYIGKKLRSNELNYIARKLYSAASRTFNKGKIGNWAHNVDAEQAEYITNSLTNVAEVLGYK